jgi:hypothetical protein
VMLDQLDHANPLQQCDAVNRSWFID